MQLIHRSGAARLLWGDPDGQPDSTDHECLLYLREMCELLWPPPAVITLHSARPDTRQRVRKGRARHPGRTGLPQGPGPAHSPGSEFVLVPGSRRPPLLVPDAPRVAAAAVRHYNRPTSRGARIGARALSIGLASGLGGSVLRGRVSVDAPPGADTIEAYLRGAVSPNLRVSMYLGPPRANRKPVLQLLTAAGQSVAFTKIGVNELTCGLVQAEHASLTRLSRARLTEITVPEVRHSGEWHELDVLVLSALPVWERNHPIRAERLAAAMNEVASIDGLRRVPLASAPYLRQLRDRLATADDGQPREDLLRALDTLTERAGGEILTYGAWHGDWTPWNMASTDRGLLVWDWERFASGVPFGFDVIHYWLQTEVGPGRREPMAAAAACAEHASELLAPLRIGSRQARLTAILYLAELATRYLVDRQAQAGARRGAPQTWLIPAVESETAHL